MDCLLWLEEDKSEYDGQWINENLFKQGDYMLFEFVAINQLCQTVASIEHHWRWTQVPRNGKQFLLH